ncbi:fibrinogen-like protein 1-like protein [Lissotriton helveticus]
MFFWCQSACLLVLLLGEATCAGAGDATALANANLLLPEDYGRILNPGGQDLPRDCHEVFHQSEGAASDGLYIIRPAAVAIVVFCAMSDGGWTVLQHLTANSTEDFDRGWQDYKAGFGRALGDHWIGNEHMHQLTQAPRRYALGVKLVDMDGEVKWGEYEPFQIESEDLGYRIRLGLFSGTAADALTQDTEAYLHDNQRFTTKDQDNDNYFQNCAKLEYNGVPGGGWWYDACAGANLNRRNVIYWQKDCNKEHPCKYSWMMVRPATQPPCNQSCRCGKDEL